MFCPKCGTDVYEGDAFCPRCGFYLRERDDRKERAYYSDGSSTEDGQKVDLDVHTWPSNARAANAQGPQRSVGPADNASPGVSPSNGGAIPNTAVPEAPRRQVPKGALIMAVAAIILALVALSIALFKRSATDLQPTDAGSDAQAASDVQAGGDASPESEANAGSDAQTTDNTKSTEAAPSTDSAWAEGDAQAKGDAQPANDAQSGNGQVVDPSTSNPSSEMGGSTASQASAVSFDIVFPGEFTFSSGAGGWATRMFVSADGSFSGRWSDADMGLRGDGYPKGTLHYTEFVGSFSGMRQVGENEYRLDLGSLQVTSGEDEYIEDGVRYESHGGNAYGMGSPTQGEADAFAAYAPGYPVANLSHLPGYLLQYATNDRGLLDCWVLINLRSNVASSDLPWIESKDFAADPMNAL